MFCFSFFNSISLFGSKNVTEYYVPAEYREEQTAPRRGSVTKKKNETTSPKSGKGIPLLQKFSGKKIGTNNCTQFAQSF